METHHPSLSSLTLTGSNGHEFVFLLKGHEDLRQDERVMQLFGLVNTLLANDPTSLRKNLRYRDRRENAKALSGSSACFSLRLAL